MPGVFYFGIWALAVALIGKGVLNKLGRQDSGRGMRATKRPPNTSLSEELSLRHAGTRVPISIKKERAIVSACSSIGTRCGEKNGYFEARSVLVDTGAELSCLSYDLAHFVGAERSLHNPYVVVQGINSDRKMYKRVWVEIVVRGKSHKVEACVFDSKSQMNHDLLIGNDFMGQMFEQGYRIGASLN